MGDVRKLREEVQRLSRQLVRSESFPSEEWSLLDSTTIRHEEVRWSELRAAVKVHGEDAGPTDPDMTDWSGRRWVDHTEQGEAAEAGARQHAKDCLWNNVDFPRRVIGEALKPGAFAMTYVCSHSRGFRLVGQCLAYLTQQDGEGEALRMVGAPTVERPMNRGVTIAS